MKAWLMSYLSFSKKERMGIAVLLLLIFSIWLLPKFFGRPGNDEKQLLLRADSVLRIDSNKLVSEVRWQRRKLFRFDPNSLNDSGWISLGIKSRTIATIRNYLKKGGRFYEPEDLSKIYGLHEDELERLIPYVNISSRNRKAYYRGSEKQLGEMGKSFERYKVHSQFKRPIEREVIDINVADSAMLETLPGIGPRLAERIVKFRELLGGFYSIDQLAGVYGINDSVFLRIRPMVKLSSQKAKKIHINILSADSLDLHPYIQRHEAKAIVNYRQQHGPFTSLQDLLKIDLLNAEWLERIRPYLEL